VIVGSGFGSKLDDEMRARVAARDDVLHLGQVQDQRLLAQLFRHCLVYVHGHSVGGTNPSLLQALGAGAPALAYDCVFNREVIAGDEDVYYDDASSLAEQLRRALDSAALRERLAAHGQARVEQAYRWSDVCDAYLALVGELTGENVSAAEAKTIPA
jgi:glycosyltransferase involved in cell wall biosynthesis